MAEINKLELAKTTYDNLCRTLDAQNWNYKKIEEKLMIECGAQGDDLPIELTVKVDPDRMLVMTFSHLPFVIQEDKRLEVAIAVSAINNALANGCFDYNVTNGHMFFRLSNSFMESVLGAETFKYMIFGSCQIVDEYNDKLLMLSKGMLTIEQFLSSFTH